MLRFFEDSRRRPRSRLAARGRQPLIERLDARELLSGDLIGASILISPAPVEGSAITGIVAKFTDADGNTNPAEYAATIHWGDGSVSQGTVTTDPNGGFDVNGSHTFARDGAFRVTAQVGDADGGSASISTTNVVGEAAVTASGVPISATRVGAVSKATVATFTDADANLPASAFSATITWGDGRTSAGMVVPDRATGGFKVIGSHDYAKSGSFSVSTTIRQGPAGVGAYFTESDVLSDGAVAADHVDPEFVNPWGLAAPNVNDFWDGNNGTGTSTVFSGLGNVSTGLPIVTIPAPSGDASPSAPSGVVANSSGFDVTDGTHTGPSFFLFATEDGTIAGWNPSVGTSGVPGPSVHAELAVNNSASGAVYKGLAILNVPAGGSLAAGPYLFATNFHAGTLDVFNSSFAPVTLPAGAFQDSTLPAGFAPFGVSTIDGNLYVTYAKQDAAKHDDVAGPGNGFVDVYSSTGALLRRLGGPGDQLELNSPWAVVQAPSSFGTFSNAILVGNFGNSRINAFDPATGAFLGQLADASGSPIVLDGGSTTSLKGLWGLLDFSGNDALYFSSGFNAEDDGLFGTLTPTEVAAGSASTTATVAR